MHLRFETPWAGLLGLLALLPLVATVLRGRRHGRARSVLGLDAPGTGTRAVALASGGTLVALLALAATQPSVVRERPVEARTDAEAYIVLDTSRSMLAAPGPRGPTRFRRAVTLALRLRAALGDVPVGAASFTDRPLPHLLPSPDEQAFASVVTHAMGVDRPPSATRLPQATDLTALSQLAMARWYEPGARKRLAIVVTDGETAPVQTARLRSQLADRRVTLLLVRVGRRGERVYEPNGRLDPGYHPPTGPPSGTAGLDIVPASHLGTAVRRARAALGHGPVAQVGSRSQRLDLGRICLLLALVPLAAVVLRLRSGGPSGRPARRAVGRASSRLVRVVRRRTAFPARAGKA